VDSRRGGKSVVNRKGARARDDTRTCVQPLIPHNRRYCKVMGKDVQGERVEFVERVNRRFHRMHCKAQGGRPCNLVKLLRNNRRDKNHVGSTPDLIPRTWEGSNDGRMNISSKMTSPSMGSKEVRDGQ